MGHFKRVPIVPAVKMATCTGKLSFCYNKSVDSAKKVGIECGI